MTKSKFIKYILFGIISIAVVTAGSLFFLAWHSENLDKQIRENELTISKQLRDTFSCTFPSLITYSIQFKQIKYPESGLDATFEPDNLIVLDATKTRDINNPIRISETITTPLDALLEDALQDGHILLVNSGYRSYQRQKSIFENPLNKTGTDLALAAKPGFSEHQLGTTVDISASLFSAQQLQQGYRWMEANAHRYGFIHTFPRGSENITGFKYEPWHIRYVGTEVATRIYESRTIYNEQTTPFVESAEALQPFSVDGTSTISMLYSAEGKKILLSPNQFSLTNKEVDEVVTNAIDEKSPITEFSLRAIDYTVVVERHEQLDAYHITIAKKADANSVHIFAKEGCKYLR